MTKIKDKENYCQWCGDKCFGIFDGQRLCLSCAKRYIEIIGNSKKITYSWEKG